MSGDRLAADPWKVAADGLAVPVFVLKPDCEIVDCNPFGDQFLRAARILRRNKGRLSVRRQSDDVLLLSGVSEAHQRQNTLLLRLRVRTGEIGCLIRIEPVAAAGLVVVTVAELRLEIAHPAGWTRGLFGFNATGAALAEAMADGKSLADFAEAEAMPIGTVRTRLKKLLAQTGTNSQAELVGILLRGGVLRVPD